LDTGLFWLILLLPLAGTIVNTFWGRRLPKVAVAWIACGVVGIAFILGLLSLVDLLNKPVGEQAFVVEGYTWFSVGKTSVDMALLADQLSILMVLIVTGVGFLIHVYAVGYMWEDPDFPRFFVYLNLFIFAMLLLVTADNYPLLLVGWEGVGLCSYFLISFWYQQRAPAEAGVKAFVVNAIGDVGILIASFALLTTVGSVAFGDVFTNAPKMLTTGGAIVSGITLMLLLGAIAKSAQIPLYTWLPDAMEGPTPVSALIHAATMVAAGVYLLVRSAPLLAMAPVTMGLIAAIGAITLLFSATIGLLQNDIKRVLAYSTISQLGYMFLAVGAGGFVAAMFHLTTHAFFKALLFLAAGSVIHAMSGEQDMRKMGGLFRRIPRTATTLIIGALALMGFPLFSGFFSKDAILSTAFGNNILWYLFGLVTSFITAFYVFRLVFVTFWGRDNVSRDVGRHMHESPLVMMLPLYILAFFSFVAGFIQIPGLANVFGDFLGPVLSRYAAPASATAAESGSFGEFLIFAVIAAVVGLLGLLFAYVMYFKPSELPARWAARVPELYQIVANKYYVDELYDRVFVRPALAFSRTLTDVLDGTVIDGVVRGTATVMREGGEVLRRTQTGYVRQYALSFLLGAVIIVAYVLFPRG
jgi:NADH-quinone oxidoreductase subunit L